MTKCNMLPNCTSVCTNLLKNTPSYELKTEEDAFMDCCMPQRRQVPSVKRRNHALYISSYIILIQCAAS